VGRKPGTSDQPSSRPPAKPADRSQFLRDLAQALAADARAEVELAVRVGVLTALGYRQREVVEITGASVAEVRAALQRLRRVSERLDG
jgi:hypothetical protein